MAALTENRTRKRSSRPPPSSSTEKARQAKVSARAPTTASLVEWRPAATVPVPRTAAAKGSGAKKKRKKERAKTRLQLVEAKTELRRTRALLIDESRGQASKGLSSILEGRAVQDATRKLYTDLMSELVLFAADRGMEMGSREQDEVTLLEWADEAFLNGRPSADGMKMWAAYTHYKPARGRLGDPLARAKRAMIAWSRIAPSHGRIPPAFPMVCGIVAELARAGLVDRYLAALVATSGCLRPGELLSLRRCDMV